MLRQIPKFFQRVVTLPNHYQSIRLKYTLRGLPPTKAKSLEQLLNEINYVPEEIAKKVDIGLPPPKKMKKEELLKQKQYLYERKKDANFEKLSRTLQLEISLDEVRNEWLKTDAPYHLRTAAEHYGVFKDLFGAYAFFTPYVNLDIVYPQKDGKLSPVFRGNILKPHESAVAPNVTFSSADSDLWTLVLSNPDGHLTEENKEYVHWFVGNIPGGDVSKGETIWDYLQPFPPLGVGFQRFIFILYKQEKKIDYSSLRKKQPCRDLQERTFQTLDFYRSHEDLLTPGSLAFFQTDWDSSVREVFHHQLNMEEPRFEYDFTPRYVAPPKWFARRKPFNMYLDKYRDTKDIAKDFLLRKLAKENPFEPPSKPYPYGNIYKFDRTKTPSWLITEKRRVRLGLGRINQQSEDL